MTRKAKPRKPQLELGPTNAARMAHAWQAFGRNVSPGVIGTLFSLLIDLELRLRALEQKKEKTR